MNLGRLVLRKDAVGLFVPTENSYLHGLYDLNELCGELIVIKVGLPELDIKIYENCDANTLFANKPESIMTNEEYLIYKNLYKS